MARFGASACDLMSVRDLTTGKAEVPQERRKLFYPVARSAHSSDVFERYCDTVSANKQ